MIIIYNKIATISWELAVYQTLCELQDQYLVKSTIKQKKFLVKFYQRQLTRIYCPDQYTIRFMSCFTASKAKCVREDPVPLHVSWLQCSALKTQMRFQPEYNLCTVTSHSLTQQPVHGGEYFPLPCPLAAFPVVTPPSYTSRERLCLVQLRTTGRSPWRPGHTFWAERVTTWNWLNSLPIKWLESLLCWELLHHWRCKRRETYKG